MPVEGRRCPRLSQRPDPDPTVKARPRHPVPSWIYGHPVDGVGWPAEPPHQGPGPSVPHPHDSVPTPRDELLAVGGEGEIVDAIVLTTQNPERSAGGGVPQADGAVAPPGGDQPSIRA